MLRAAVLALTVVATPALAGTLPPFECTPDIVMWPGPGEIDLNIEAYGEDAVQEYMVAWTKCLEENRARIGWPEAPEVAGNAEQ